MKRKWLEELGLTEEQIDKIMKENGDDIENAKAGLKEKETEIKNLQTTLGEKEKQLGERDQQLEDLKKASGNSEDLNKKIQELQEENKKAKETHEAEMKNVTLNSAIKVALAGKVHDEDLVAGLFDKEKLVINDGKVIGLDEQVKALQESKSFLFKAVESEKKNKQPYVPAAGADNEKSLAKSIAQSMNQQNAENPYTKAWG